MRVYVLDIVCGTGNKYLFIHEEGDDIKLLNQSQGRLFPNPLGSRRSTNSEELI